MTYDAVSPRTYEDRNGNEKTAWTRVGRAFEKDGRTTIFLDAYPIPDGDGSVKIILMEPKQRDGGRQQGQQQGYGQQRPRQPAPAFDSDLDDDVPF